MSDSVTTLKTAALAAVFSWVRRSRFPTRPGWEVPVLGQQRRRRFGARQANSDVPGTPAPRFLVPFFGGTTRLVKGATIFDSNIIECLKKPVKCRGISLARRLH
jgi:hypothetical protein